MPFAVLFLRLVRLQSGYMSVSKAMSKQAPSFATAQRLCLPECHIPDPSRYPCLEVGCDQDRRLLGSHYTEVEELRRLIVGSWVAATLVLSLPAFAVVYVKTDGDDHLSGASWATAKATIQAAINAAPKGDGEVWIKAGVYGGGITVKKKASLIGGFSGSGGERDPAAYRTVIDAGGKASAIKIKPKATVTVDGVEIDNGSGREGGGICCDNADLTVKHSVFRGNHASRNGGAICMANGVLTVEYCTFKDNESGRNGGAICFSRSRATITRSVFTGNSADCGAAVDCERAIDSRFEFNIVSDNSADNGGGVSCRSKSVLSILSNVFVGNSAHNGGAIYYHSTDSLQSSNLIKDNSAQAKGGGIYWAGNCFADSVNDTFIGNTANQGGAACATDRTTGWLTNAIIYDNHASQGGAAFKDRRTTLYLYCCCYYLNGASPFVGGVVTDPVYGNFEADPLFVDYAAGDYHIRPDSPCVDAGDNWYVEYHTDWTDLDGKTRIVGTVDIGCYELQ